MEQARINRIKIQVQRTVTVCSVLLLVGKFVAFLLTNSVGILTDALESIVNVTAGFITLYSIRLAAKPKDDDHPFGHGKVEFLSASVEGILILLAGGLIVAEGIKRLFEPTVIDRLDIGIALVAAAGLINYLLGWYSIRVGKKYNSVALIAGGKHLQSDTYSSVGLVAGLLVLYFTGLHWIDSALAILFGGIIAGTGISILRRTTANLMDKADPELLETLRRSLLAHREEVWIDIHNVKIIQYGNFYFIDCDVTLPWYYNIAQGHAVCDDLKERLSATLENRALVSIHSDPCNENHCGHCALSTCTYRKSSFVSQLPFTLAELTQSDEERNES